VVLIGPCFAVARLIQRYTRMESDEILWS